MELHAHADVQGEFAHLAEALLEGPANWMPGMFDSPTAEIVELHAVGAPGRWSRAVRVELGEPSRHGGTVLVPIRWHAVDGEALFPVFDGRLRLRRRATGGARVFLEGRYEPPGGIAGQALDALVMRDVAQSTVDDFAHRVAGVLGRNALARKVAEQVGRGTLTLDAD